MEIGKYFDKKNPEKYIGRWCLYGKTYKNDYDRLFVYDIKEGIMKYSEDKIKIKFINLECFYDTIFFVSPFEDDETEKNDMSIPTFRSGYVKTVVMNGDESCNCGKCDHVWMDEMIATYPPVNIRRCIKCGKTEESNNPSIKMNCQNEYNMTNSTKTW